MPDDNESPKWTFRPKDRPHIDAARARHAERGPVLDAIVERNHVDGRWHTASPYEDEENWRALVGDAFGTNSRAICETFIGQLSDLCRDYRDEQSGKFIPSSGELSTMLGIVNSVLPKNPAEAALAAQMCAVHFAAMRMGVMALRGDERSAAILSRLTRTYAKQMETLHTIRGNVKATKQHITVSQEKHVHHHQHVHVEGDGGKTGGQPHEQCHEGSAKCAALRSEDAPGNALSVSGDAREGSMQAARREGNGGSEG